MSLWLQLDDNLNWQLSSPLNIRYFKNMWFMHSKFSISISQIGNHIIKAYFSYERIEQLNKVARHFTFLNLLAVRIIKCSSNVTVFEGEFVISRMWYSNGNLYQQIIYNLMVFNQYLRQIKFAVWIDTNLQLQPNYSILSKPAETCYDVQLF